MRMNDLRFRHLLLACLAGVALVAGACSDDSDQSKSDSDDKTETTDAKKDSEESPDATDDSAPDESTPDDTAPEEGASADFEEKVSTAKTAIEGAKDPCDLYEATMTLSTVGNPETQEQTKLASELYVAMLRTMAETSSDPKVAETLSTGADEFEQFAQDADFDPEKMDLAGEGPDLESSAALDEAMNSYAETEFTACMGTTSAPTSQP